MKKSLLALLFLIGFGCLCFAADESQEPPLIYTLEIDGQQHELLLDKPITITGAHNNPEVKLRASSTRQFTYGNVAFQYPASFTWEAEIVDENSKSWVLSGNDFKLMYFILPYEITVEEYAQSLANQFGEKKIRISETERTLGSQKLKGRLLFVRIAGVTLNLEVYEFQSNKGTRLLVLQDSPPDNSAISKEGETALHLLSTSFEDTTTSEKQDAGQGD